MKKLKCFSDDTRDLISIAHNIALDLGYDELITIHFFLADCILNGKYSSRELFFNRKEDVEKFYETQRASQGRILADTPDALLPLSEGAKLAIRNSLKETKKYHDDQVLPFHLFLAISKFDDYFLSTIIKPKTNLYLTFVEFYKKVGYISDVNKKNSFISKLRNSLKFFLTNLC